MDEFSYDKQYNLTLNGPRKIVISQYNNKEIGTIQLSKFGYDIKLIFKPRGGGYLSGSAPIGSKSVGFSHALFLEGSTGNESFFVNCVANWRLESIY